MIGKQRIEDICRSAGMVPVARDNINGTELFIADGFSAPPHHAFRRFDVGPTDFPYGMYITLWWVSRGDEKLDTGQPLFFDAFHDSEYSLADKKLARINSAKQTAVEFLQKRKKAH